MGQRKKAAKKTGSATELKKAAVKDGRETPGFPNVGIGASAGGLAALEAFLANVPAESGMAFVIVQHLDPTHQNDFFFRALAEDQQEHGIGVILSGMGSDGILGLRAIQEKAGVVFVQEPASAKFAGCHAMP